ncbi:MAG: EamA family transporter [Firmicutes bacterium]|nr:EamA family transporter [Bacillota bacterium]
MYSRKRFTAADAVFLLFRAMPMFLYEAYVQVGVGTASLLYYCGPVIVMALSAVLFRETITAAKLAGFIAVLAGIFLINAHISGGNGSSEGFAYGLAAAVMYSVMVIANKKSENVKGMENSCLQLVVSFLTVAVCVGIKSGYHISLSSSGWIWMIVLGVLNTGVGCWLYFSSIGDLPVQTVAILGYIEPLSAVLFSAALLGERMAAIQIAGVVLIIGGAVLGTALKDKKFFGKQGG